MSAFGLTFKEIRQEKNYNLKEVAADIVSVTTLSTFENGHTDIKLSNFMRLLNRINCTFDEFSFRFKGEAIFDINRLIKEFIDVGGNRNDNGAKLRKSRHYAKLYDEFGIDTFNHMAILFEFYGSKAALNDFEKVDVIKNYLKRVESWDKYEIFLFHCMSFTFTPDELIDFNRYFLRVTKNYKVSPSVDVGEIILNQSLTFVRNESFEHAQRMLDYFHEVVPDFDFTNHGLMLLSSFIKGLIMISTGDASGKVLCDQYVDVLNLDSSLTETSNQMLFWLDRAQLYAQENAIS
ncbi:helix-turn-helix transcriptional regulator [Erysipelothrix sp. HDW6C]|uniref:helix-turn-helix domain-containing protein n=1 Tax=Erysipelothrix sp. HDW6C TaxID=2714930 RepID=UPI00140C6435|nr:helix-turn-helix transcriptional regulator [Erysipelothrix sp. HDW6C]QIK69868.1 helix-turn-helix transcriptional regulator [Erysipelothrix sp. HDW6C]